MAYEKAIYDSALKAFNSILKDRSKSGSSLLMTNDILTRLIEQKPLTPIEDTDDVWYDKLDINYDKGRVATYQCKRMSALFKDVYEDGTIKYHDNNSIYCVDVNEKKYCMEWLCA